MARNRGFVPRPAAPPKPITKVIKITRQQTAGILERQARASAALQQAQLAQVELNIFCEGVIMGHGIKAAEITNLEDKKHLLTVKIPQATVTPSKKEPAK